MLRIKTIAAALLVLLSTHVFGAAPTVKLATLAPEGSSWDLILRDMAQEWKTAPAGGVVLRIYPGGVMGDEPDMIRKLRIGQIDAAMLTIAGLSKIDPWVMALGIPMFYESEEELDFVLGKLKPELENRFEAKGYKILNWGEAGWITFFGKEPIRTPEDLKKSKFFVWAGDAQAERLWKEAGYHPVALAATDILPALQTGLINAFDTTPLSALSFQWFALAPHMAVLRWAPLVGATIIANRVWKKIPPQDQKILLEAAAKAEERMRQDIREGNQKAIDIMKQNGLTVHTLTSQEKDSWRKVFEDAYPKIVGALVPKEAFEKAKAARAAYREKSRKQ